MKTKIKRHSRAVLSIVLTLCMLVSCMTVGIIATDAAKTADQRVGATYYNVSLYCGTSADSCNWRWTSNLSSNSGTYTDTLEANTTYYMYFKSNSNDYWGGGWELPNDSQYNLGHYSSITSSNYFRYTTTTAGSYTFTFSFQDNGGTIKIAGGSGGSGGGGGEGGGGDEPSDLTTASKGAAPVRVLVGTDIMFYIRSYNGEVVDLCNSTSPPSAPPSDASSKDDTTANTTFYSTTNIKAGNSYVQVTKTSLSSYNRITNNLSGGWSGNTNQSTNISSATGGELFWDTGSGDSNNGNVSATSCTTEIAPASVIQGGTITFSTTCGKTKMSHGDQDLYYQYYIDNETTPIAVASEKDSIAASGTTAQDFVLSSSVTSSLSVGSHTLKTVATDGGVYYISDTDTFTVTAAEVTHAVTFSASPSEGGTVNPSSGTEVGESTAQTITAEANDGYSFSSWTFGTGITGASTSANPTTITTKASGNYTVQANFTPNNYEVTYGSAANGTFTVKKTSDNTAISSGGSVAYNTGITVACTPYTGYQVSSVSYTNASGGTSTASLSGNDATFNMPATNTTITVTFAGKPNAITTSANPGGSGSVWVASSESGTEPLDNYDTGATVYLRAKAEPAYTFTKFVVTYADGTSEDITSVTTRADSSVYKELTIGNTHFSSGGDGSISVVGYFTKKPTYDIIVATNDRSLGTAIASLSEAYQGQTVTLEVIEDKGTYTSHTIKDSSNIDVESTKSGNIITFTMPNKAVTATVTFTEYSTDSIWYYNGYNTDNIRGTSDDDGYAKRMTEAMVDGKKYSYYQAGARGGNNQLFSISYKSPAHPYGEYDYIYFHGYGNRDGNDWDPDHDIYCWFQSSDGKDIKTYAKMEFTGDGDGWDGSYKKWRAHVPYGAKYVYFKDHNKGAVTKRVDLSAVLNQNYMYFYISGKDDYGYNVGWTTMTNFSNPVPTGFYEYFNDDSSAIYKNTTGHSFGEYGVTVEGGDHRLTNPSNAPTSGTYYVLVLYPGNTYTINGDNVTVPAGSTPYVVYTSERPGTEPTNEVNVYAKDGAIRNNDGYGPYTTLAKIADTVLSNTVKRDGANASIKVTDHSYQTANPGADSSANDQDYQTATVDPGDIITVTTTINDSNKDKYYVKGFIVNGETKAVCQWNSSGVYTFSYTVTGEERNHKVEITPVYFLKNDTNTINFSIDGFEPDLQFNSADGKAKWGDTIYVYPFYSYNGSFITGRKNAFGSYPGQPMVFDGGKYYIQIPKSISYTPDGSATAVTATVSGVTMSNGYWDHVHRSVMGWDDNHNELHRQTYDYDDFYKISNELSPDNITYEFKYRTTTANKDITTSDTYESFEAGTFGNGFNELKDIYGRPIDIFGNLLNTTEQGYSPVYVVSKGYQVTNAGSYATEWEIFYPNQETAGATSWTKAKSGSVSAINPSALTLKNASRFATYGDSNFTKYKDLYTLLDKEAKVKKQPVLITFEKEILGGSDEAERSDGQWFHSKNNDIIHANIQIEYSTDGTTWTADTYATSAATDVTGVTTGGRAYFTNTEKNKDGNSYYGQRATGDVYSNNKEYFTFAAESSANYKFVGWYRKVGTNYYAITGDAQSQKTTNDTYVARFVPYTGGNLTVNNTLYTAGTYKGNGTTQVKLDVINSNSASAAAIYTTGFKNRTATIGQEYIVENSSKFVRITLKTIPSGIDSFQQFSYKDADDSDNIKTTTVPTYFPDGGATEGSSYTLDGTAAVKTIIIPITGLFGPDGEGGTTQLKKLLEYYSELNKWTLKYELKYKFNGREFGTGPNSQWYVAKGDFESNEFNTYVTEDGGHYHIARDFLSNKKPYERDFMKSITWNFDAASTANETGVVTDATNHTITYKWEIHQNDDKADTERKAIFTLPYCYNPEKDYKATDYVPVTKYQQRQGTLGVKYYTFAGYFYTDKLDDGTTDPRWAAYLAEVASWQNSSSDKYDAKYAEHCPYGLDQSGVPNAPAFNTTALHDGIPIYDKSNVPTFNRYTNYGKRFVLNDVYPAAGASEEDYEYVTAAPSVWKDNDVKYFSHWQITNNDGKKIAKCYALRFNFSAYDNYQIEAIYEGKSPGSNYYDGEHEPLGATISYLDDSRNQYNEGGHGSNTEANAQNSGDVLFKDFAVAYSYDSKVFNTYTDKKVRVGVAIEWVKNGEDGALINDIDGTDMENYEDKYSSTESDAITAIRNKLLGSSTPNNIYIKPIASNIENDTGYKPISDTKLIDNKNRLKYHYAVYNEANGTSYSTKYGVRLYRAYSYIMVDEDGNGTFSAEEIAVSAKPAYFTFNDVANRKSD